MEEDCLFAARHAHVKVAAGQSGVPGLPGSVAREAKVVLLLPVLHEG